MSPSDDHTILFFDIMKVDTCLSLKFTNLISPSLLFQQRSPTQPHTMSSTPSNSTLTTEEFNALSDEAKKEFIFTTALQKGILGCGRHRLGPKYEYTEKTRNAILSIHGTKCVHNDHLCKIHVDLDVLTDRDEWNTIDFTQGTTADHISKVKASIANRFVELNIISSPHEFDFYFDYHIVFNQRSIGYQQGSQP